MALLALQFGIQPIVTKKYTSPKIIKSTVIFMQEVVKLVIAYVGISLGGVRWKDVMSGECRDMIHAAIVMYWLLVTLPPHGVFLPLASYTDS